MLEDLYLNSISEEPVNDCINNYIKCLNTELKDESKARVLCYLASQQPLTNSLGIGAMKGFWDFSNSTFSQLIEFLESLR